MKQECNEEADPRFDEGFRYDKLVDKYLNEGFSPSEASTKAMDMEDALNYLHEQQQKNSEQVSGAAKSGYEEDKKERSGGSKEKGRRN